MEHVDTGTTYSIFTRKLILLRGYQMFINVHKFMLSVWLEVYTFHFANDRNFIPTLA